MDITRRGFLGMLGAAVATPTYFFAPIGGWKSDVIINPNDLPKNQPRPVYGTKDEVWQGQYNTIYVLDGVEQLPMPHQRRDLPKRRMSDISFSPRMILYP